MGAGAGNNPPSATNSGGGATTNALPLEKDSIAASGGNFINPKKGGKGGARPSAHSRESADPTKCGAAAFQELDSTAAAEAPAAEAEVLQQQRLLNQQEEEERQQQRERVTIKPSASKSHPVAPAAEGAAAPAKRRAESAAAAGGQTGAAAALPPPPPPVRVRRGRPEPAALEAGAAVLQTGGGRTALPPSGAAPKGKAPILGKSAPGPSLQPVQRLLKIPKLPMVSHGGVWYRARLVKDAGAKVFMGEWRGW